MGQGSDGRRNYWFKQWTCTNHHSLIEKRKDLTSVALFCKTLQPNAEAVFPSEQIIKDNVRSGSIMVTIPSLESALEILPNNAGIDLNTWVKPLPPFQKSAMFEQELKEKNENIFMYSVL